MKKILRVVVWIDTVNGGRKSSENVVDEDGGRLVLSGRRDVFQVLWERDLVRKRVVFTLVSESATRNHFKPSADREHPHVRIFDL